MKKFNVKYKKAKNNTDFENLHHDLKNEKNNYRKYKLWEIACNSNKNSKIANYALEVLRTAEAKNRDMAFYYLKNHKIKNKKWLISNYINDKQLKN